MPKHDPKVMFVASTLEALKMCTPRPEDLGSLAYVEESTPQGPRHYRCDRIDGKLVWVLHETLLERVVDLEEEVRELKGRLLDAHQIYERLEKRVATLEPGDEGASS